MAAEPLLVERAGAVVTLTLNRPEARNALDTEMLRALARAVRDVRRAGDVRSVVLTGAGDKAFSAGADVGAMAAMTAADGHVFARLEELDVPVVAALNGVALGGGLELALACDLIVASERARLGQPEINLGLIPGFGGTQRLALRIGLARTRELVYLGHMITAEESYRIGLVNRVVPADRLRAEAAELGATLAAKAPVAMRQAKRATAFSAAGLAAGCRYEIEAFGLTFATEDRSEGLRAFREKRAPVWKGR